MNVGPDHRYGLLELLGIMQTHKVQHLKMGGMEITLQPSAFDAEAPPETPADSGPRMPTEREMLFAASGLEEYDPAEAR